MANEKVLPLEQIAAASTPTDSARIVIHNSAGSANYIDLATLKRLVRESIQIGGRNLVKDSAPGIESSSYPCGNFGFGEDAPEHGETLTVTIWGDFSNVVSGTIASVWNSGGTLSCGGTLKKISEGIYRQTVVWKVTSASGYTAPNNRVCIFQGKDAAGKNALVRIDRIKVERGNTATDWTPAPEDWGGVKLPVTQIVISSSLQPRSKSLTIQRKGGRHERGESYQSYRKYSQRTAAGRNHGETSKVGFQCDARARVLSDKPRDCQIELSGWNIFLWCADSSKRRRLYSPNLHSTSDLPGNSSCFSLQSILLRLRRLQQLDSATCDFCHRSGIASRKEVVAA